MKKYLVSLISLLFIASPVLGYTVKSGDTPYGLWGNNWRTELAKYGISDPRKLPVGLNVQKNDLLGAYVPITPALIDTYLAANIDKTATSMTLSNGTTRDGVTLSGTMCFTLDSNTPVAEYVCGTASGTSITGMTRGINLVNPNASSSTYAFPHRRFASVQVTDYPTLQFITRILNGNDATQGNLTFGTNKISGLYTLNGSFDWLKLNTSTNMLQWSNNGSDYYNFTSSSISQLTPSSTRGLGVLDSQLYINASSTTGMDFDANGALHQNIGNALVYSGNAINITTTSLVNGGVATSTPTAGYITMASSTGFLDSFWIAYNSYAFFGTGSDGDATISVSTTLSSNKNYNNLTINDGVVLSANNYQIFVRGTLTFIGTGKITANGGNGGNGNVNGTAGTAGASVSAGYYAASIPGVVGGAGGTAGGSFGGIGSNGTAGASLTTSVLNTNGATGQDGSSACTGGRQGTGGSAGTGANNPTFLYKYTTFSPTNTLNSINNFIWPDRFYLSSSSTSSTLASAPGSGSGGGGAGFQDASCTCTTLSGSGGGGSGAAGGIVYVAARRVITNSNVFAEAKGGNGGNGGAAPCAGAPTLGLGGGGAGGNGGLVVLIYNYFSGTGTSNVSGGTGGSRADSVVANSGTAGKYIYVNLGL